MSENSPTDNATDLSLCQGLDDEATTSTSAGSRGSRGKSAQYYRDYRARKRAEQEKESLNRTSDPSTIADSSTINVAGSVTSKKRKSAAEYQREYRARKKAKRNNILINSLAVIPSISTGGFTTTHQSTKVDQLTTAGPSTNPQTTAGTSINPQTTAEPSFNPPTTVGPSTSSDIGFVKPTRRKTPAEYQREYRARKNAQRESMRAAKTNDDFTTPTDLMVHETCHNKSVCYGCNENFDTFAQLTTHRLTCKAIASKEVTKLRTLDDVLRPQSKEPAQELKCKTCNETFTDVYYMNIHQEVHHNNDEKSESESTSKKVHRRKSHRQ